MEAHLEVLGDFTVIKVIGPIESQKNEVFREICRNKMQSKKVIFCLENMKFVGSSGIQIFFKTLEDLNMQNPFGVKVTGLSADFQKLLSAGQPPQFSIFINLQQAIESFSVKPYLTPN